MRLRPIHQVLRPFHLFASHSLGKKFFERQLAASTGYTSEIFNGGKVDNRGLELTARYTNTWGDWSFASYLTYSINRNKIIELAPDYVDPYTGEPAPLTEMIMGSTSIMHRPATT